MFLELWWRDRQVGLGDRRFGGREAVDEAIYKIDGVEQATASFKAGLVTALINPEKTNRAALEEALKMKQVELKAP